MTKPIGGHWCIARNSQWGGCFGGLGAEPPAAGGQWGSGGEGPSGRKLGVWGQSPQPPEARGSGGRAPSAQKFCIFFAKITSFYGYFDLKIMLLKRGLENWQCKQD